MIEILLSRDEGKTLEFKEDLSSPRQVVRSVVAFANTAGGTIVVGIRDRTKAVVGVSDALAQEERLASVLADCIQPQLIPDIQIHSWRDRELLVIVVPHSVGPYYVKAEGADNGVYVRLGSTNRRAGPETLAELRRLAGNVAFDELPRPDVDSEAVDFRAASEFLSARGRSAGRTTYRTLGLLADYHGRTVPTNGALLLFGRTRREWFPDAVIRCARFAGTDRTRFLDQAEIVEHLPRAVDNVLVFIERHTLQRAEIGRLHRKTNPEYPTAVIREAATNSVVHADYSSSGTSTQVAVFDDRIEFTNPGGLPFGLTLPAAMAGVSKLRNRVIGRTFRELGLIEQWGSGIGRMLAECSRHGLRVPRFEEVGAHFRVTVFNEVVAKAVISAWQAKLGDHLRETGAVSTKDAAKLWRTSDRTARARLRSLVDKGILAELGTGPRDPHKKYVLRTPDAAPALI